MYYIILVHINFKIMRYIFVSDIGGFLWWVLIKFCKTNLADEQTEDKWSRNIFFVLILFMLTMFIATKFF